MASSRYGVGGESEVGESVEREEGEDVMVKPPALGEAGV
jgi:hypothetical protein